MLEPPRLQDLASWEGCFITSTSRLLLPVDEASLLPEDASAHGSPASSAPNGGSTSGSAQAGQARRFERGGLVQRLEQLVLAEVAACSEPLFGSEV